MKCKSTKYTNTLNLHKNNATVDSRATEKNITNYNIKNFNSASKLGNSTNSTGSASSIVNLTEYEKETIQSLRFDNAIISQEIISLNKELNKIKIDNKSLNETAKKIEKEKNELVNKFKSKSENLDKIKKENEELMILIQTSNYKSFISVEVIKLIYNIKIDRKQKIEK